MTAAPEPSLEAQKHAMQVRLHAQRRVIAGLLSDGHGAGQAFPRSMTMRLLTERPQMTYRVLGGLFGLFRNRS